MRTAVVFGGSRGIGCATSILLAQNSYHVHVVARSQCSADAAVRAMPAGSSAVTWACDVREPDHITALAKTIGRVDVLVNSAGIAASSLLVRQSQAAIEQAMATNLFGTMYTCRAFAPFMIKHRAGAIINIASVIGLVGSSGQSVYAASKAGVVGLTRSLARELGPRGIRVNAIAPGFIQTDMTSELTEQRQKEILGRIPHGAFGTPEDVAQAVLYLATAGYVNGAVLRVDGGLTA